MVAVAGTNASPPWSGVKPQKFCMKRLQYGCEPKRAAEKRKKLSAVRTNGPLRKMARSISGQRTRASTATNAASSATPTTADPQTAGEYHGRELISVRASIRPPSPEERRPEAPPIDGGRGILVARFRHEEEGEGDRDEPDRAVDQEDPAPVVAVDQQATEDRPGDEANPGDAAVDPDRQPALVGGEGAGGDRRGWPGS